MGIFEYRIKFNLKQFWICDQNGFDTREKQDVKRVQIGSMQPNTALFR